MKKFLIVAHYSRFLVQFEMNNVKILQDMGYEVHYATNYEQEDMYADAPRKIRGAGVILHQIDFVRSPYRIADNIKAYRQLVSLMEKEKFAGVHCHTPMAGALARLAANKTKTKPVLYTAHGFHFYKGCPVQNRLIYETAERFLARYTDALITINEEDYQAAKAFNLRGKAYKIPGAGVDTEIIQKLDIDCAQKRKELGIPENAFVLVSVGELNDNKDHQTAIRAFAKTNIDNSYYVLCGEGEKKQELKLLVQELNIEDRVIFAGFRNDIGEILKSSNLFVFPSKREGLGLAAIEGLAAGLPVIASRNRGSLEYYQKDVVDLFEVQDVEELCKRIISWKNMLSNKFKRDEICKIAQEQSKLFDYKEVVNCMKRIYSEVQYEKEKNTACIGRV